MEENRCRTYFDIVGEFDPDEMTKRLGLKPFRSWKSTDIRRADGKQYGFAKWAACLEEDYDPYVYKMMEKTIAPLQGKIEELNAIRKEHDVKFYLTVVPHVIAGGINPCLAPSLEVMRFCVATETEIDLDLYTYNSEEK